MFELNNNWRSTICKILLTRIRS